MDSNGKNLGKNHSGFLIVQGPNIMKGYYHNSELTKKVIKEGWLYTGDIAFIDENNLLYVQSRKDDMIIKGGMNIFPSEIESYIKCNQEVEDVNVYTSNNKLFIEVVLFEKYKNLKHQDVLRKCLKSLPTYMLPDKITIVDQIKTTISGKRIHKDILEGDELVD